MQVSRGHSLMVKSQPSKLTMRVRFPLPAMNRIGFIAFRNPTWFIGCNSGIEGSPEVKYDVRHI